MTRERTALAAARATLRDIVAPVERRESIPLAAADGRVLADPVAAGSSVPHYARAAMDGYAIRAADTDDGDGATPATLQLTDGAVDPGEAAPVSTGSALPDGADAVVRLERAERTGDGIAVARTIQTGKDVAPVGEDVTEGQQLYAAGHRLRPSDLGLLRSTGEREVRVLQRPQVAVLPTGGEVVAADPDIGEVRETNSVMLERYVQRWGGVADSWAIVPDDVSALESAIGDASENDLVVTIGGSSVGERDLVTDAIGALGEIRVHGVAIKPGHPVGFGVVGATPVLALPGYPVSAIITAVQFLRPALHWLVGTRPAPLPTERARLAEPIQSEEGITRFSRVRLAGDSDGQGGSERAREHGTRPPSSRAKATSDRPSGSTEEPARRAVPTTHSGAGVLSSVALADGWVVVPETEGDLPAGTAVTVQDWEYHQ